MTSEPVMSVIVLVDRQRERGERCLSRLLSQSIIAQLEILLLDFAASDLPPLRGSDHPSVRVVPMTYDKGFGGSRALGVRLARAPIVAFIEEHVTVRPGWAEATLRAHQGAWAGVVPEVHNPAPDLPLVNLIFLTGFNAWTAPMPAGETRQISSQNSAFKRDILLRYDADLDRLEGRLCDVSDVPYPPLAEVVSQLVRAGGKRLRPAVAFLVNQMYSAPPDRCGDDGQRILR